jgi:hypothetical protein
VHTERSTATLARCDGARSRSGPLLGPRAVTIATRDLRASLDRRLRRSLRRPPVVTYDGSGAAAFAGGSEREPIVRRRARSSSGAGARPTDTRALARGAKAGAWRPAFRAEQVARSARPDSLRGAKAGVRVDAPNSSSASARRSKRRPTSSRRSCSSSGPAATRLTTVFGTDRKSLSLSRVSLPAVTLSR